ncbi:aminotransferase class III-fold pyridoxal phosphate-dependent enzyme [Celeribacter halophilus]|uniref:aspartate aminotransferase family protein n=1 Tax=Celeribacter halophilus TaxID=576117 RepID=UPI0026E4236A|nr:aminotransferase class III-fold pyridoxal phosphate-dependent enzyme [Celeribacter halophilus]MDO6721645.1 aminotransferase class III-fold pyridoxal phosphate-dependent enzyme [Celeribacter halophilus]
MTPQDLLARDAAAVAGIEKLRFFPIALESGKGSWLTEVGGRKLLDLSATWTACGLGHGHPKIIEAMTKAAQTPAGAGGLSAVHPDSVGFAEELLALTPGEGERRVYFGHAGTDANEVIFRAARMATGKRRIVTFKLGYHGGIGISMGVSGVHIDAGATPDPDLYLATYPNPFRPHADGPDPVQASLEASIAEIDEELAKGDVCVLMAEPILSDGGMILPPKGFLTALHATCRKHDVLLAVDEVKMGLGRPGVLHAFQLDGITPEIVTFGKVIGSGLPLSAAVAPAWVIDGPPATALLTTAGNPICTAVGRQVMRTLVEEDLPTRAGRAGKRFMTGLREVMTQSPVIGDVRGAGLAIGLELVTDKETMTPDPKLAAKVVFRAFQLGAVVHYVGGNTLEITPPLIITDDEVDTAVSILAQSITDAHSGIVTDEDIAPYAGW